MKCYALKPCGPVLLTLLCSAALAAATSSAFAHGPLHEQIELATQAIEKSPNDPLLYLKRADLERLHEDRDAAIADVERARTLASELPAADLVLGRIYLDAGWGQAAWITLDRYLKKEPNNSTALRLRGQALDILKKPLEAAADYTRAIHYTRQADPDLYLMRAQTLANAGHVEEALLGLNEGIKQLGPLVSLQSPAIKMELKLKHYEAALARIDSIIAQSPRKESWLKQRGEVLLEAGRLPEAQQAFADSLKALHALPPSRRQAPAMVKLEKDLSSYLHSQPPK